MTKLTTRMQWQWMPTGIQGKSVAQPYFWVSCLREDHLWLSTKGRGGKKLTRRSRAMGNILGGGVAILDEAPVSKDPDCRWDCSRWVAAAYIDPCGHV